MRNHHWLGLCCAALLIPPLMASDDDESPAQVAASQATQAQSTAASPYPANPGNLPGQASYDPSYNYRQHSYRFPQRTRTAGPTGYAPTYGSGSARRHNATPAYRQARSQPQLSTSGWDQRRPSRRDNGRQARRGNHAAGNGYNQRYSYGQPTAETGYGADYGYAATGYRQDRNWSAQTYPKSPSTGLNPWDTPTWDTDHSNPKIYGVPPRGRERLSAYTPEWDSGWNGFTP